VPPAWAGDLVFGKSGKRTVATHVERKTGCLMLVPLTGRNTLIVGEPIVKDCAALTKALANLGLRQRDSRLGAGR
jgi:IS30 family transposase